MANEFLKKTAQKHGVRLWQIADRLGINDGNFSRKLRHELPDDERENILRIIDDIVKERE